jgi:hypothetical protein
VTYPNHTITEYLQQAAQNAEFAEYIRKNRSDRLDWAATCLFYSAVHYVNAYLVKSKIPIPRRHHGSEAGKRGRTNIVQQDPTLSAIYPQYRHLDDESRDARYELKKPSEADYDGFLSSKLNEIKSFVVPKVTM